MFEFLTQRGHNNMILYNVVFILLISVTNSICDYIDQLPDNSDEEETTAFPDFGSFHIENYNLSDAMSYYTDFVQIYRKKYNDKKTFHDNFEVFKMNLKKMNRMNQLSKTSAFQINMFTDLTLENFTLYFTGFNASKLSGSGKAYSPAGNASATLDWRSAVMVAPPKFQGNCSNSYVFAAVANIEAQYARTHSYFFEGFSDQQGFDCETEGNCKDGGVPHMVIDSLMHQGGAMTNVDYPYKYKREKGTCNTDSSKVLAKIVGWEHLTVQNEDELQNALFHLGPLITTIYVSDSIKNYRTGILNPKDCFSDTNHAVLLSGYGIDPSNNLSYWIIKNSWGTHWGESGYLRLIKGRGACNIGKEYVATSYVDFIPTTISTTTVTTTLTSSSVNTTTLAISDANTTAIAETVNDASTDKTSKTETVNLSNQTDITTAVSEVTNESMPTTQVDLRQGVTRGIPEVFYDEDS